LSKRTASLPRSALGSSAVTAASTAVVTGLAAVVGVVIARQFGRGPETDGFFAAYAVFIVLVLAASALRVAVLPRLARAQDEARLGGELAAYAVGLAIVTVPLLAGSILASSWAAGLLIGNLPDAAQETAAEALRWMVPAAVAQLFAGLAASALAALDDYHTAAIGFAAGSAAGLALILWRVEPDGIVAVAWGMAANGALALSLPLVVLARRGVLRASPAALRLRGRLGELGAGVALPLVLQGLYVVCVRFAGEQGTGAVTSLGYAYLIAAALVAVTASSLSLVSSVPLARRGLGGALVGEHVAAASWLALTLVAGAAGVFALAGETVVRGVLGPDYGGDAGTELGRLVVYLSPWMAVSVGVSVTFPLLFVAGRVRALPLLALVALAVHVPLVWAGQALGGLGGNVGALALTTALVFAGLLALLSRTALSHAVTGLVLATATTGGLAVLAFALARWALAPIPAAAVGLAAYVFALVALRPPGLTRAWLYLRALA